MRRLLGRLPLSVRDWSAAQATARWGVREGRLRPVQLVDRWGERLRPVNGAAFQPPDEEDAGYQASQDAEADGDAQARSERSERSNTAGTARIQPMGDFLADFVPPDYVLDGIIQRGRLYALTSPTGHGKTAVGLYGACMVASGRNVGTIQVTQGSVVFLAGENPDDLRTRCFAACQTFGINPSSLPIWVLPGNFPMTAKAAETLRQEIDQLACRPVLIVIDTAAAYFDGDDDNHNVQMGTYARNLRILTTCEGQPAVLVLTHPVKAYARDNLLPRGGGAFLNELDGNLVLWSDAMGEASTLHWHGKIRGPDFSPITFAFQQVQINGLQDGRGRPIVSIVARLQSDEQADAAASNARSDENLVLRLLRSFPGASIATLARKANWISDEGTPHKGKVHRLLKSLQADKLAEFHRGKWRITKAGKQELEP